MEETNMKKFKLRFGTLLLVVLVAGTVMSTGCGKESVDDEDDVVQYSIQKQDKEDEIQTKEDTKVAVLPTLDLVPITEEYFPDPVFREIVNGFAHSDKGFTKEDIENITFISMTEKNISSLEGIKYFTNLRELRVQGNAELTSLDVSGMTNLEELVCYDCNISNLNLTGCEKLVSVAASDNSISDLQAKGCSSLQLLGLYNNKLEKLDLSECKSLEKLDAEANLLTSIQFGSSELLEVSVCNNQLSELDVSGNPMLEELNCSENQISSINLSGNVGMKRVFLYDNQLTILDFPACSDIEILNIRDNLLTSVDLSCCPDLKNKSFVKDSEVEVIWGDEE